MYIKKLFIIFRKLDKHTTFLKKILRQKQYSVIQCIRSCYLLINILYLLYFLVLFKTIFQKIIKVNPQRAFQMAASYKKIKSIKAFSLFFQFKPSIISMRTKRNINNRQLRKGRPKIQQETAHNQQKLDPGLFWKFKKFINEQHLRELKMRLHEFYGKNFAINYKNNYNFYEQWQNKRQKIYDKSQLQVINKSLFGSFISFIIMTVFSISIWTSNLSYYFSADNQISSITSTVQIISLVAQIMDVFIKLWYNTIKEIDKKEAKLVNLIKLCSDNILCIIYLILSISITQNKLDLAWILFQIFAQFLMYSRAKKIYESFHYFNFALKYEYQFKAFDLIVNLLIFAHFMSIILYSVTKINPDHNWFESLNLHNPNQFTRYAYSFYFCTTTILTVGYGDITPKNPTQIIIVTCLEIFGIIIFGYLVNEIGYNLSALRKRSQTVKKQLILIEKMRKYYKIDDDLIHKAKSYLINRQAESEQLSPEEEKILMAKFNEQLRNQLSTSTSLSIVKSSIFFLCRWSKAMQNSVANQLLHILFSPGQKLYQPQGKQRIYLIRLGKIGIYTERRGNRLGNRSVLKEISVGFDKQVTDNCYGYTAVISARPVRLYAISKNYTSAFYIQKQKFNECINSKNVDFEYYHEIKNKIDQSSLWQSLEVPSLSNSKHHYSPTKLHVIKKAKNAFNQENQRLPYVRLNRKLFRGKNIAHDPQQLKDIHRVFIPSLQDQNLQDTIRRTKGNSMNQIQKFTTNDEIESILLSFDIKKLFHHYFESAKEYSNFFINHNLQRVLKKLENEYNLPQNQMNQKSVRSYYSTIKNEVVKIF